MYKYPNMIERKCEHCRFFEIWPKTKNIDGYYSGICRKNSPIIKGSRNGTWPIVKEYDWCGKFKPKKGNGG